LFFLFLFLALFLGILRFEFAEKKFDSPLIKRFENQKVIFQGQIISEPKIEEKYQRFFLKIFSPFEGKAVVFYFGKKKLKPGDYLKGEGKIKSTKDFSYFKKDKAVSVIFLSKILERHPGNLRGPKAFFLSLRSFLKQKIEESFSGYQREILLALLLGRKDLLSDSLKEKLNLSGLRHITAISGMHITVLISILFFLFLGIGFGRKMAIFSSIGFILFFLMIIGFQASAVRATIFGISFLLAQYLGRQTIVLRILVFAAAIMLFLNPFLLRYDWGFQFSFLASLGIIFWQRFFEKIFSFLPNFLNIRQIFAMALSAQVFVAPLIFYYLDRISVISPLSNIFIVPILPFVMISGFLFEIGAIIGGIIKSFFYYLLFLQLLYFEGVINFFASLPFSVLEYHFNLLFLILTWLVAIFATHFVYRKTTTPFFLK